MRVVTFRWFAVLLAAILAALLAVFVYSSSATGAANVPNGFDRARVAGGLDRPTAMAFAPDGRIFVAEQGGKLRVIKNGRLLSKPFARFRVNSEGERGLLGVALDPNFSRNGYVYVYETTSRAPVHNRVLRLKADGNRAKAGSRKLLFRLNNLSSAKNHNGGAMHFGKDGRLYIAVGDNARQENAQSLRNLHGKMLRINKTGSIPKTNPFYDRARGKNRAIWARGLRNPFSFAVQPGSGKMYINDVGQKTWEEINRGVRGANYGWSKYEGPERDRRYRSPVFAYQHGNTGATGCAITGGTFYNPSGSARGKFPRGYVGDYFFADFCNGWIRKYDPRTDKATRFATGLANPVDLKVGPDGSLYYLARGTGSVDKIRYRR
jgi:glucose/arabinose dehydrogenase